MYKLSNVVLAAVFVLALSSEVWPDNLRSHESPAERFYLRPSIGTAEMLPNGTMRLSLTNPQRPSHQEQLVPVPGSPWFQERLHYGQLEIGPSDPHYEHMLRHLGGLEPGEAKPVPPWPAL
jgi:hypothetical protein